MIPTLSNRGDFWLALFLYGTSVKIFTFSPIKPLDRIGDSGPLLLAKRKHNRSEQYLVKHAYCDSASNEYIYSKLAHAMGYKMPDMVLFTISPEEKRNYFQTEYIVGAKYLDIVDHAPSYDKIREQAVNWRVCTAP